MAPKQARSLKLAIDSQLANTTMVAMAVRGVCEMTTFSPAAINRLELCLVEVVNNAIEHAYGNEPGHTVEVVVGLINDGMTISVSDWGAAMSPAALAKEYLEMDAGKPETWLCSGRGLHIIKQLMDGVDYCTVQGKNSLTMTKQFDS